MKTKVSILAVAIIIIFNFCSSPIDSEYFDSIKKYSLDMNHSFADTSSSPLTNEGLAHFEGPDK